MREDDARRAGEVASDRAHARAARAQRSPGRDAAGVPRLGRGLVGGHEPDQLREVARVEETLWVEVAVTEAHAEVEATGLVFRSRAAGDADDLAADDTLSGAGGDAGEEGIGGAELARVGDDHVQRAGDRAGERHLPVARGAHRRSRWR